MNEERMKEIFVDEAFVKELFGKETAEEAQALLAEKDIDVSVEELVKLKDIIVAKLQAAENGESVELTEEEMKDVTGGLGALWAVMGVLIVATGVMMAIPYVDIPARTRW